MSKTTPHLDQLLSLRSSLENEVIDYLYQLAREMAALPSYFPVHLHNKEKDTTRFDDIRQNVRVLEDRGDLHNLYTRTTGGQKAGAMPGKQEDNSSDRPQDVGSRFNRSSSESPRSRVWDDSAGRHFRRGIILGDPGFGKTWLLRFEARRIAAEGYKSLRAQKLTIDNLVFPVFIRLSDLNRNDNPSGEVKPLEDTLVDLIGKGRSPNFVQFLRDKISSHRFVLLLDGWDEVPLDTHHETGRQRLRQRLEDFCLRYNSPRILLTSRIVGYTFGSPPIPEAQELLLLSLERPQINRFVQVWFGKNKKTLNDFKSMIGQSAPLQDLQRIPLLMTLMCRLFLIESSTPHNFPSSRAELYERCLKGLLLDWRQEKLETDYDINLNKMELELPYVLLHLSRAAWTLLEKKKEQFSYQELAEAFRTSLGYDITRKDHLVEIQALIDTVLSSGILSQDREEQFIFLHRTFFEYLAARGLSEYSDWIDRALELIYDIDFREFLQILGECNQKYTESFLEALLIKNLEDYLQRPLILAGLILNRTTENISHELCTRIEKLIWNLVNFDQEKLQNFAFLPVLNFDKSLLRYLEQRLQKALELSIYVQHDTELKPSIHPTTAEIVEAFGQIASEGAVDLLMPLLKKDDAYLRLLVAEALGKIGSEKAVPAILSLLDSEVEDYVALTAIDALGQIGSEQALPKLYTIVEKHSDSDFRTAAVDAVGFIGSQQVDERLVRRYKIESVSQVRIKIIEAFGRIGSRKAIPCLISSTREQFDQDERQAALNVLQGFGATSIDRFQDRIISLLTAKKQNVRIAAIELLGNIGTDTVVDHLIPFLSSNSTERTKTIQAFGKIQSDQTYNSIISHLEIECRKIRRWTKEEKLPSKFEVVPCLGLATISIEALGNFSKNTTKTLPIFVEIRDLINIMNESFKRNRGYVDFFKIFTDLIETLIRTLGKFSTEDAVTEIISILNSIEKLYVDLYRDQESLWRTIVNSRPKDLLQFYLRKLISIACDELSNTDFEKARKEIIVLITKKTDSIKANQNLYNVDYIDIDLMSFEIDIDAMIQILGDLAENIKFDDTQSEEMVHALIPYLDRYFTVPIDHEFSPTTIVAIEALGKIGSKLAVSTLMSDFDNYNTKEKETTIQALGRIGSLEAMDCLVWILLYEKKTPSMLYLVIETLESSDRIKALERILIYLTAKPRPNPPIYFTNRTSTRTKNTDLSKDVLYKILYKLGHEMPYSLPNSVVFPVMIS